MAGLGPELDGSIVTLAGDGEDAVEVTAQGLRRVVRRVPVPGDLTEVRLHVMRKGSCWQLVSDEAAEEALRRAEEDGLRPPRIEERRLVLTGGVVAPPTQLPPMCRNERTYFINPCVV